MMFTQLIDRNRNVWGSDLLQYHVLHCKFCCSLCCGWNVAKGVGQMEKQKKPTHITDKMILWTFPLCNQVRKG